MPNGASLSPLIPPAKSGGHPRTVNMREVVNAIFYLVRGGCAWRALPHDFPCWSTVWTYFRNWRLTGVWERMHTALREAVRSSQGREATPSAAILDSQSVKTTEQGGERGYDGGKHINGRKRHLLVDTNGLILDVVVHPANIRDPPRSQTAAPPTQSRLSSPLSDLGREWLCRQTGGLGEEDAGLDAGNRQTAL